MAKPSSRTTVADDTQYVTRLSGGTRTVIAHGATPEEAERRASRVWDARDQQLANAQQSRTDEGLRVAFEELAHAWAARTAHLSSPAKLVEDPAYRQIIGLGPAVLPFVLRDLEQTGRFWFPALHAITGENPVSDDAAGDIDRMTEAWIEWGRANGLA